MPRFQGNQKGDCLDGDALLEKKGRRLVNCLRRYFQPPIIEHRTRPDWVCLRGASVSCPGKIAFYYRLTPDLGGGPIGLSRFTKLDMSELVKRL